MAENIYDPKGLFAHLAPRFSVHPENLATEALAYVLRSSPPARVALARLCARIHPDVPADLLIDTQVRGEDGAQPDLVGRDRDGDAVLVMEVKFWAGLTENQPVEYVRALPISKPAVHLILAPEARLRILEHECQRRLTATGIRWESAAKDEKLSSFLLDHDHRFGILSWRGLLAVLEQELAVANDSNALADIRQLQGLTEYMDKAAFLPLRSEELAGERGRRVHDFVRLVDAVVEEATQRGFADTQGLRTGGSQGTYGRYLRLHEFSCFFFFSPRRWYQTAECPFWLNVKDEDWNPSLRVKELLRPLELERPPRLFVYSQVPHVPIHPPVGTEWDEVVETMADQLQEVAGLLAQNGTGSAHQAS